MNTQQAKTPKLSNLIHGMNKGELLAIVNNLLKHVDHETQILIAIAYAHRKFPRERKDFSINLETAYKLEYQCADSTIAVHYKDVIKIAHELFRQTGGENSREIILYLNAQIKDAYFIRNGIERHQKIMLGNVLNLAGFRKQSLYKLNLRKTENVWTPQLGLDYLTAQEHISLYEEALKKVHTITE